MFCENRFCAGRTQFHAIENCARNQNLALISQHNGQNAFRVALNAGRTADKAFCARNPAPLARMRHDTAAM
jgi:hypothetical protein